MIDLQPIQASAPSQSIVTALRALDERALRDQVLPRLLPHLGLFDVRGEHGPLERGKDLLAVRQSPLGTREFVGFVVKSGDLNARVGHGQGVRTVLQQVEQVLEHEILEKPSSAATIVRECWVVTNGEMPQYALDEILPTLRRRGLDRCVRWIDGPMLADLLQRHVEPKILSQVLRAPRK